MLDLCKLFLVLCLWVQMKAQMLPASRCVLQIQQAAASVQQHSNAVVDGIAGGALRVQDDDKAGNCERLFKGLVFFLGREVPRELREQVLFVIRAYGGVVAWQGEGSPMDESDERITHQVRQPQVVHVLMAPFHHPVKRHALQSIRLPSNTGSFGTEHCLL